VAERVRGELALAAAAACRVDMSRLHLDMTAVRFTGAYTDSALVEKGWAADRTIARQVKTMQASTPDGVSVYYRPHHGSAGELPCFTAALERLAALAPPGLVAVADSGFGYLGSLCAADAANLRFVVPLRADTGWADRFRADVGTLDALDHLDHFPAGTAPARGRTHRLQRTATAPRRHRPRHQKRSIGCGWPTSGPRRRPPPYARDANAPSPRPKTLIRVRNGLGGRYYKTKKQVDTRVAKIIGSNIEGLLTVITGPARNGKPSINWQRNPDAITAAAALDGLYAVATNLPDPPHRPLTALDVLTIYKDQWIVEQRHRDLKQTLHVRPIFLHNDDRIEALIAIVGIALLIFGLIEADLRRALGEDTPLPGILPEHRDAIPTARAVLTAFAGLHATYTPTGLVLDPLTPVQRLTLAHLNIPLPNSPQFGRPA
jgi:hypothetical protein